MVSFHNCALIGILGWTTLLFCHAFVHIAQVRAAMKILLCWKKSYLKKDLLVFPSSCKIENDSFKNPKQALSCIGRSGRLRLNKADGVAINEGTNVDVAPQAKQWSHT